MNYRKTTTARTPEVPCECSRKPGFTKCGRVAICKECKRLWKLEMTWKQVGKVSTQSNDDVER
jgi:hypothetical protein